MHPHARGFIPHEAKHFDGRTASTPEEAVIMSASSTAAASSTSPYSTPAFWERMWRTAGIQAVGLLVIAYVVYGTQPQVGASAAEVVAFYDGGRTRILIGAILSGLAILNLLWFAAALRTAFADAGRDGWGAAATASSAAVAAVSVVAITIGAALAYSLAGLGRSSLVADLNDLSWACVVMSSFPRAMLIMSGSFGLWRSGMISNALFGAGVAAIVLTLLGGTTWLADGVWAPDGLYSRLVSPAIGIVWILVASRILLTRVPAARAGW